MAEQERDRSATSISSGAEGVFVQVEEPCYTQPQWISFGIRLTKQRRAGFGWELEIGLATARLSEDQRHTWPTAMYGSRSTAQFLMEFLSAINATTHPALIPTIYFWAPLLKT